MNSDERFMKEALELAAQAHGRTATNPLVGACLVRDGEVIGQGLHRKIGADHAEKQLQASAPDDWHGATLYLTLEPCIHHGRTPPCLPILVDQGLDEIVIASEDPGPSVNGKGLEALDRLDETVTLGVLERENCWLNRHYFHHQQTGRPYIDLKLALSADGYLATPNRHSQWITGEASREHGHRLRSRADAVMVGGGTVRTDNPTLTDRVTGREDQPKAVVVARSDRGLHPDLTLFSDRADETILVVPPSFSESSAGTLQDNGVTILAADRYNDRFDWRQVLPRLRRQGIGRILVEGGSMLAGSLLEQRLINELHLYYSGRLFGNGIPGFQFESDLLSVKESLEGTLLQVRQFDDDVYVRRLIEASFEDNLLRKSDFNALKMDSLKET
jgi:diaminohydroxyphosphoribosylaminopyrimidine deaminase/5-amino-6-(5-phosphoribosylamino)uracil reductase